MNRRDVPINALEYSSCSCATRTFSIEINRTLVINASNFKGKIIVFFGKMMILSVYNITVAVIIYECISREKCKKLKITVRTDRYDIECAISLQQLNHKILCT